MCARFGIVTDEGGSAEVVEDGRTGFIAAAAQVDQFEQALERAWAAREQWSAIGAAAARAIRTLVPSVTRLVRWVAAPSHEREKGAWPSVCRKGW